MLKELEEMSIGQKLYDYQCKSCGFEKGVPEFLIEEFRMDMIFGAIAPLEDEFMPELVCPNCRAKFGPSPQDFISSGVASSVN